MGDLKEIDLVKEGELDRSTLDEVLYLGCTQSCQVIEPSWGDVVSKACLGEHPPVSDKTDLGDTEALLDLAHLGGNGLRVSFVTPEYLDGYRHTFARGEKDIDDLEPSVDAVFWMAEGTKRRGTTLEGSTGDIA